MSVPRFRSTAAFALRARNRKPSVERATFVTFSIGAERFAAAVEAVERVLRWTACTPADGVAGALPVNVQYAGREIPLVDFADRLGLTSRPSPASRVLVLNVANGWLAVIVDEVHEIATVDAASISLAGIAPALAVDGVASTPAACAGARGTFVRDRREIVVLDIARALGYRFI